MPNQDDSNPPSPSSQPQPLPQTQVTPAAPKDDQNQTRELAREFRIAEKWQIGTNIGLAVIGIFALLIYNGQLREMRKATEATGKAADAAKQSADTATDAFKMEKRRAEDMEEAICRVQGGGTAARDNMYPLEIINSGKVSARNVEAYIEISLNAVPSNRKLRTLATLNISANEIPKEKDEARRLNLPLSARDWENIADTNEIIVQSGTLKYENGFDRINTETVCDFWLYLRTPEDKLNPIQGRGATCERLPELLKSFPPKGK